MEELTTHILCSITFSSENRDVYEIMWEKCGRAGQATYAHMAHAYFTLRT